MAGVALTVMDSALVSSPVAFAALTVKLNVPSVVGVPEITPVLVSRESPVGKVPLSMLHVMGASPVAWRVWLYAVPETPSGREAVVMTGATAT